jgi:hypothetical protein
MNTLYALRHIKTGRLMTFTIRPNGDDAEFCNSTTVELELPSHASHNDIIWVTPSKYKADNAATVNIPWYNSDTDTPMNAYAGQLEVVEFSCGS